MTLHEARSAEARGDYATAQDLFAAAAASLPTTDPKLPMLLCCVARCQLRRSHFSESLDTSYRALSIARSQDNSPGICAAQHRLAAVYAGLNDLEMSMEYCMAAYRDLKSTTPLQLAAEVTVSLAAVHLLRNANDEARQYSREALVILKQEPHAETELRACLYLATAAMQESDHDDALHWADQAIRVSQQLVNPYWHGKALYTFALVHAVRGEEGIAADAMQRAIDHFGEVGDQASVMWSKEKLAELREKTGHDKEAYQLLKEVLKFERGAAAEQRASGKTEGSNLLANYRHKLAMRFPALSAAELRICDLLHQGLATKEIAIALTLSPATVERHRANIRAKLPLQPGESLMGFLGRIA